jgi:hypothetical protein
VRCEVNSADRQYGDLQEINFHVDYDDKVN